MSEWIRTRSERRLIITVEDFLIVVIVVVVIFVVAFDDWVEGSWNRKSELS